jgi:hypothetical protein
MLRISQFYTHAPVHRSLCCWKGCFNTSSIGKDILINFYVFNLNKQFFELKIVFYVSPVFWRPSMRISKFSMFSFDQISRPRYLASFPTHDSAGGRDAVERQTGGWGKHRQTGVALKTVRKKPVKNWRMKKKGRDDAAG